MKDGEKEVWEVRLGPIVMLQKVFGFSTVDGTSRPGLWHYFCMSMNVQYALSGSQRGNCWTSAMPLFHALPIFYISPMLIPLVNMLLVI